MCVQINHNVCQLSCPAYDHSKVCLLWTPNLTSYLLSGFLFVLYVINQEVPAKALPYVDSALKTFYQLKNEYKDTLKPAVIEQWFEGALCKSTQK